MFTFSASQKTYEIGWVKVGGNVGDNPTVMIGSIFYKGDKNVQDKKTGSFDREKAEELISSVEEISDKTGLPAMLDVVCNDSKTVEKYLGFAADATRMPILIDAVSEEVALSGLDFANELNVIDRTILNSINSRTTEQIYQKIKEVGLENVILLTYSSEAILSYKERIKLVETLIPKVEKAGINLSFISAP